MIMRQQIFISKLANLSITNLEVSDKLIQSHPSPERELRRHAIQAVPEPTHPQSSPQTSVLYMRNDNPKACTYGKAGRTAPPDLVLNFGGSSVSKTFNELTAQ
jgi:hypothetical protein